MSPRGTRGEVLELVVTLREAGHLGFSEFVMDDVRFRFLAHQIIEDGAVKHPEYGEQLFVGKFALVDANFDVCEHQGIRRSVNLGETMG
jgi:hypothetical protein